MTFGRSPLQETNGERHSMGSRGGTPKATSEQQLVRPTEAQLRWAQFHRKVRARETRERIQALYSHPSQANEVPDALPDDGASTCSEGSAAKYRKQNKPKVSRGRRALLRVSKRQFEKRRDYISRNGYLMHAEKENDDQTDEMHNVGEGFKSRLSLGNTKRRPPNPRRRQSRALQLDASDEESRIRRFEAAHAMMMNLRPTQQQTIIKSTRRWTRPKDKAAISIDGRSYEAWKWGLIRRQARRKGSRGKASRTELPFDRRASWLVHLPVKEASARRQTFGPALIGPEGEPLEPHISLYDMSIAHDGFLSPGQMRFDELVRLVQDREGLHPDAIAPDIPHRGFGLHQYEEHLRRLYEAEKQEAIAAPSATKRRPIRSHFIERHPEGEGSVSGQSTDRDFVTPKRSRRAKNPFGRTGRQKTAPEATFEENKVRLSFGGYSADSNESDFFESARKMHPSVPDFAKESSAPNPRRQVGDLAMSPISESQVVGSSSPESFAKRVDEETFDSPKASGSNQPFGLGARVGGLFNIISAAVKSDPASKGEEETLRAVAMFRKARNERGDDGSSSTSTFQLLPDGLRRVVKGLRGPMDKEECAERESIYHQGSYSTEGDYTPSDVTPCNPDNQDLLESPSPSRSNGSLSAVSPEHSRLLSQKVMQQSALRKGLDPDQDIIDTDGTTSDASGVKMDPKSAAALMLSPTILTKRHQQAIRAVESRNWEQVFYLINANPWLAEMIEVTTDQYLLHKVALYGAGEVELDPETGEIARTVSETSPDSLNKELIRMFPASVHKFDSEGNLPLHMAAASGNFAMVNLLGEKFQSGASVRNNDGMLPLHLGVQACVNPLLDVDSELRYPSDFIVALLQLFPAAVAIPDNDGDLPIHVAASNLRGEEGVDVVYVLLDEANRQAQSDAGIRLPDVHRVKSIDDDSISVVTDTTATATDASNVDEDALHCNMVRNDQGLTPLSMAIQSLAGWEVIEAIACGPGGHRAVLLPHADKNNSLHLLLGEQMFDPAAALSILKVAPQSAAIRNAEGKLPIEVACEHIVPKELVLALALVDLPVDLNEKDGVSLREGHGGSWWYLTCESEDHHVDAVEDVVSICTYQQLRELCFMQQGSNSEPVISRATPQCRSALRKALRFIGRFEFLGSGTVYSDTDRCLKVFEALDFGTDENPIEDGRKVLLRSYFAGGPFLEDSFFLHDVRLDLSCVEETCVFVVDEETDKAAEPTAQQFCLSTECPNLTLDRVVDGMQKNEEFQFNVEMRNRYLSKVCVVLRTIAKALRHLHAQGLVHGEVCLENCGRFDEKWKLTNLAGSQAIGEALPLHRLSENSPPESVVVQNDGRGPLGETAEFVQAFAADPSVDIWAFGKLAFEALTGDGLIGFDSSKEMHEDHEALLELVYWSEGSLHDVADALRHAGVSSFGVDLVTRCLVPNPLDRPKDMEEILNHGFWKDFRRKTATSTRSASSYDRHM